MPQRRGHGHARPRDVMFGVPRDQPVILPIVEKRGIVTVYTTLTSSGFTGDLTTLPRGEISTEDGKDTTTKTDEAEKTRNPEGIAKAVATASSSSFLPTAISLTASSSGALDGTLVAFTSSSAASTTPALTTTATSTSSNTAAAAAATASTTAAASSSKSSGSDDVATKAGIVLGVLGGLFVVLALVYWLIVRRRKQLEEQQRKTVDDEKLSGSEDDSAVGATAAVAPQLHPLRPMTELFTGMSEPGQAGQQTNKSIARAAGPTAKRAPGTSPWERSMTSDSSSDQDPFGKNALVLEDPGTPRDAVGPMTPISEASTHGASPEQRAGLAPAPRVSALTANTATTGRVSAITMDSATVPPLVTSTLPRSPPHSAEVSPIESADDVPVGQAITSPEATPFTEDDGAFLSTMERQPSERRQSVRKENVPAPLDLTLPPKFSAVPPSPAGTEFSMHELEPDQSPIASASAAAIAAAGGPANSTVHRVQLDFKPGLDDEMGLQAGQLVRLLHEYDDGWALCIRLDRSEQGVVPRTCLSTRPVKPRTPPHGGVPRGPPVNPQGRPRDPSVSSQRSQHGPGPNYTPAGRPMGPPGPQPYPPGPAGQRGPGYMRPMGPGGRPMGPGSRPQSPGGPGPRPQSPSGTGRKHSPPGPSNRQQEYRPSLDHRYGDPSAGSAAPGQAY